MDYKVEQTDPLSDMTMHGSCWLNFRFHKMSRSVSHAISNSSLCGVIFFRLLSFSRQQGLEWYTVSIAFSHLPRPAVDSDLPVRWRRMWQNKPEWDKITAYRVCSHFGGCLVNQCFNHYHLKSINGSGYPALNRLLDEHRFGGQKTQNVYSSVFSAVNVTAIWSKQSRDKRTEIQFFCLILWKCARISASLGWDRREEKEGANSDKDFPRQNDSRVCRGVNLSRVMSLVSWL